MGCRDTAAEGARNENPQWIVDCVRCSYIESQLKTNLGVAGQHGVALRWLFGGTVVCRNFLHKPAIFDTKLVNGVGIVLRVR